MIWIVGGTSETKELASKLLNSGREDFLITVVSEEGLEQLSEYESRTLVRRMDLEGMKKFISERKVETVIDMSHPFAKEASRNAKKAASECGAEYIRFLRDEVSTDGFRSFESIEELREFLKNIEGTVFFTTGSKDIGEFESIKNDRSRFIYRILPAQYGIDMCKKNNVELKDIIAMLGPFSKEFNKAMLKNYSADYMVTKNSGSSGGTQEKLDACVELGVEPLILKRDKEEGLSSIEEVLELIR